jgi:hypothetical protein
MGSELEYASDKQIANFQSEALSRVSDSLDEWQNPSCPHADFNCKCKHKTDYYKSAVFRVEDWIKFPTPAQMDRINDLCFDIRSDFTVRHAAKSETEFVSAQKEWTEDKMPHDAVYRSVYTADEKFGNKNASFLVVSSIWKADAVGKIISRAKKTVNECEKENGYYLYSERLTFQLVADRDDIHLVMWFSSY